MNCLVKIVWDWNGTLLDDVDLCFSCINRLLVNHELQPLSTLNQYREVFTFPIEDYYKRVGFNFDKIPFSILAHEYMEDYQEKSYDWFFTDCTFCKQDGLSTKTNAKFKCRYFI